MKLANGTDILRIRTLEIIIRQPERNELMGGKHINRPMKYFMCGTTAADIYIATHL